MKTKFFLLFAFFPLVTFAQNIGTLVRSARAPLTILVYVIVGLALIAFLWGLVVYIWKGTEESARTESKKFMVWGIIGLTVMVSVWGLVAILANVFGMHIPAGITPQLPTRQ